MNIRTRTGSEVLEVFWFDEDRSTVGCLVTDGHTTWAGEYQLREIVAENGIGDVRSAARCVIQDETVRWAAAA